MGFVVYSSAVKLGLRDRGFFSKSSLHPSVSSRWQTRPGSMRAMRTEICASYSSRNRRGSGRDFSTDPPPPPNQQQPFLSRAISFLIRQVLLQMKDTVFQDFEIDVIADSSWDIIQGKCQGVVIQANKFSFAGVAGSSLDIAVEPFRCIPADFLRGTPLSLATDLNVTSEMKLTREDILTGTFIPELFEQLTTELLRVGISGAMGEHSIRNVHPFPPSENHKLPLHILILKECITNIVFVKSKKKVAGSATTSVD